MSKIYLQHVILVDMMEPVRIVQSWRNLVGMMWDCGGVREYCARFELGNGWNWNDRMAGGCMN